MVGAGEGTAEGAVRREGRQRAGTRNLKHFDYKMPKFHVPALGEGEGGGREGEVREEVEEASERAGTRNLKHFYSQKLKGRRIAQIRPLSGPRSPKTHLKHI